jgi:ParB family chromosome partitioning protein
MAKLNVAGTAGFNAGKNFYAKPFRVSDIAIDPEISRVFKIQDKIFEEISENIKKHGFDKSQPVVVWKGKNILVDGHTRLAAAKELGLEEVPVVEKEFEDMEEAILYTFERQVARRNLTSSEILTAAQMIHGRKERDGKGRAAEQLAERLGISPATVYQARKIMMEAPEEDLKAVQNGEKSITAVYNKIRKKAAAQPVEKEPVVTEEQELTGRELLQEAVSLLVGVGEEKAAAMLVIHFVKEHEKDDFSKLLPKHIWDTTKREITKCYQC